jgi:hypothetical protein
VRFRFRGQEGAYERAKSLRWAQHAHGELRDSRDGVTVGAYADGLVTVEGRLAALLHGPDDHRLVSADGFRSAPAVAAERFGLSLAQPVGVGRADLASELVFDDGRDGLDLLRAAASLDVPWAKIGTEGGKRGTVETVYVRSLTGRTVLLRLYDKGRETGEAAPGTWLRLERQRRYRKAREPEVDDVLAQGLGTVFVGRELARLVAGVGDVHVCDRLGAVEVLRRLASVGRIPPSKAERLAGFVLLDGVGLPARTQRRRASELRELGIALEPLAAQPVTTVPLASYLGAFAEAWAA